MKTASRMMRICQYWIVPGMTAMWMSLTTVSAQQPNQSEQLKLQLLEQGLHDCSGGNYNLALSRLTAAYEQALQAETKIRAASALAQAYIQTHQPALAEPYLRFAYEMEVNALDKARYAIDFANWQQQQGQVQQALVNYDAALQLGGQDAAIAISVSLNRLKLDSKTLSVPDKLMRLQAVSQRLLQEDIQQRARFDINLGLQAKALGAEGQKLAFTSFEDARETSIRQAQPRLLIEALDQLGQLYEDAHRYEDASVLMNQAILASQVVDAHDLLIQIEWRQGRILRQQAKTMEAIAAYQRAVGHIEAIRADIPVEYQDGRSSFRETLEPVYLGLADLLLQTSDQFDATQRDAQLRRARDVLELIKQTELQDYLGDRCVVDTARANRKSTVVAADTAILYPVILPDRLELLLETSQGLSRQSMPISATKLRADVIDFGNILKDHLSFKSQAKRLYQSLLAPIETQLQQQGITTLVIVPDGALRLLPFAALYDGQYFAVEKYAIAVVPALSLTNTNIRHMDGHHYQTLLAGISEPGAVVDKLPGLMVEQLLAANPQSSVTTGRQIARSVLTRGVRNINKTEPQSVMPAVTAPLVSKVAFAASDVLRQSEQRQQLQHILALAGVDEEIRTLQKLTPGQTLLNSGFTVAAFGEKLTTGQYQIVHVASHGVFGGTADSTFLMAHDDVITMDKLQHMLRAGRIKNQELELLTLSACETAEGDDRAPLGLSGAALKAHARSALGSLWPVSDDAATLLMGQFYRNLSMPGVSKARSLQKAQLELLKDVNFNHPFYWAPFIMVGSWL